MVPDIGLIMSKARRVIVGTLAEAAVKNAFGKPAAMQPLTQPDMLRSLGAYMPNPPNFKTEMLKICFITF